MDFPGGSDGKASVYNLGDPGLIPGLGRPLEKGTASPSSILAWRIPWTSPRGRKESDKTEWLSLSLRTWSKNTYLFSYWVSEGQEPKSSLAVWSWIRISQEFVVKLFEGTVFWKLNWGRRLCFQEGTLTWLLTRDLICSSHGPLCWGAWVSSGLGSWLHS